MMFKFAVVVCLMLGPLPAQTRPDCSFEFRFNGLTGFQDSFDNRQTGCTSWVVSYTNTGHTVVALEFQSAPDAGGAPGTFVPFAGTLKIGVNPNTSITQAMSAFDGYFPWVRVNLTASTTAGTITGTAYGWRLHPPGTITQPVSGAVIAEIRDELGAAFSNTNPLPVDDAAGSLTVDSPQLPAALVGGRIDVNIGATVAVPVTDNGGALTVDGTVTANQGTPNVTPWNQNLSQVGGNAVATAASGIPKVGVVDEAGANFTDANPLPVEPAPLARTRISKVNTYAASETDIVIWTPAAGKRFVALGVIVVASTAGVLRIFDNTNTAGNTLVFGSFPAGVHSFLFPHPWTSGAVNNVLKYTTGTLSAGDITVYGYEI